MVLDDGEVHPSYDLGIWVKTPYFATAMDTMFDQMWNGGEEAFSLFSSLFFIFFFFLISFFSHFSVVVKGGEVLTRTSYNFINNIHFDRTHGHTSFSSKAASSGTSGSSFSQRRKRALGAC